MTDRKRAIGLVRVSSSGQAERGMGQAAQRSAITAYAERERLELLEVVKETASGAVREGEFSSLEHRPLLRELLARAEDGAFDVLVVASFDRLSRDELDAQLLKRWFAKFGVSCLSAAGEANGATGAIAELIDRLLGAIHDFDRKRLLERVRAGKAEGKRRGRFVHGGVPYGYRIVPTDERGKTLAPVEPAADVVRRIFAHALDGHSPGRIAKALNRDGIPGPRGRGWNRQTIANILANETYTGVMYGVRRAHPALVSRRTFNRVQARRSADDQGH